MSSSPGKAEVFRTVFHPLLSISVSLSIVVTTVVLAARLAGVQAFRPLTLAFVLLAPVVEAAIGNLLYKERAGMANRVRELVIYLLLIYVVFSLLQTGPFLDRFRPGTNQILPILVTTATWLVAFGLHNRLRGREGLLRAFAGKHGGELRHALIDRQHDMALTVRELRSARNLAASGFVVHCILVLTAGTGLIAGADLPLRSVAFVLFCLSAAVTAISAGSINTFVDEYAANGLGRTVPFRFFRRRILLASLLVAIAFAGAFLLSRSTSIVPVDAVRAFFRWFAGLFDREPSVPEPPPVPPLGQSSARYQMMLEMLQNSEITPPPLWFRLLAVLLRRLAVALAAGVAAALIFGPLFSSSFRKGVAAVFRAGFYRQMWKRFWRKARLLARWFLSLKLGRKQGARNGIQTGAPEGASDPWRKHGRWKPSLVKRRQMDRVVSVFASIVKWGEKHGLAYRPPEGVQEYLIRVGEVHPERFAETRTCTEVFWMGRYSRHNVPRSEMRAYVRAARRICSV